MAVPVAHVASITAPVGATVFVGRKTAHFVPFIEIPADSTQAGTHFYTIASGMDYNYRVMKAGKLTQGGIFNSNNATINVTDADMDAKSPLWIDHNVASNGGYNVADIFLNGTCIGHAENMYIPHEFQASGLRKGENELLVHILPVVLEARKYPISAFSTMLKYNYVPLKFDGRRIIITDSRIKHAGSISAFLERKKECEKALRKFQSIVNIRALCDLSVERFETCKDVLMEPVLVKRARHVVCENFRTIRALSVFRVNKPQIFGKLMKESHISLRDDYEVTCPELDFLAEEAWKFPGVLGSRMTGRGFGGCTVSIVDTDRVDEFCSTLEAAYLERFQRKPNFYIADAGDGAREI